MQLRCLVSYVKDSSRCVRKTARIGRLFSSRIARCRLKSAGYYVVSMTTDLNRGKDQRVQFLVISCNHFKELLDSKGGKLLVSGTSTCLRMTGKFLHGTCQINKVRLAPHQIQENLDEICFLDICQFWLLLDNLNAHEIKQIEQAVWRVMTVV